LADKKNASKSFKGKGVNSGFRIVYAHFEEEEKIVMVEIYHKSNKDIEDKERTRATLENLINFLLLIFFFGLRPTITYFSDYK